MALSPPNNVLLSDDHIQTLSNSDVDTFMEKCKRGAKRKRDCQNSKEEQVIQVRAKRGQATDSHSVAERARRNKINDRLKCLQTLIPGCYEPMGMAVMLDAVISYVHSLQNQIEFLSMKLSAASMYCGFSSPSSNDAETMQGTNYTNQSAQEIAEREGFGGFVINNYY